MAKFRYNVNTIRIQRVFISSREISKENTTKEIPGLMYLMKLCQNQKLESELNYF